MLYRIVLIVWFLMVVIISSIQGISHFQTGHLFMYSDLDPDRVTILDTQTLISVSYPARLAYQNVEGSSVGTRFYFDRSINYPDEVLRFVFNLSGVDVVSDGSRQLLDSFVFTIPDRGYWMASPDASRIAYISIIEGKSYFAVLNSEGEALVPLQELRITANKLIWSADSQQIYLLNLSNDIISIYEYDFDSETLSEVQAWIENSVAMYPSPAGDKLLFYTDNSNTLFAYTISTEAIEEIVHDDDDYSLETAYSLLIWSREGNAFLLAKQVTDSDIQLDVLAVDGTLLYQEFIHLPYSSSTAPNILFATEPFIASIATPDYPLCLYYFNRSYLHCLPSGNFTHPIGFSAY